MEEKYLNEELLQTSIGVLLGDCSIQKNKSKSSEKYRLKFLQGEKHKEYIYHLHERYKDYVISQPFYDKKRKTYSFQTIFHSDFKVLSSIFHNSEYQKSIGEYFMKNNISPIILAYWFMDDGGLLSYNKDYPRKGIVFNTQGFSFSEVEILSQNLNKTFNLESWVKNEKGKPIIAVSGKKYSSIKSIIFPHIIDSMKYKLPKERQRKKKQEKKRNG